MEKGVSIIVAALNEQELISSTVYGIFANCNKYFNKHEIILVNDGSTDDTGTIMERLAVELPFVTVVHHKQRSGLGAVLQTGLKLVKYDHTMLLCGDGGLPGESLPPIFEKVGSVDLVIPYMKNIKEIKTPFRYLLSRSYTIILNILFQQNLHYYNGLPVYKTQQIKEIPYSCAGFAFQAELLIKLIKSGSTYVEVGTNGAEKSNRSRAISLFGFYEVFKMTLLLIWEILLFKPNTKFNIKYDSTS